MRALESIRGHVIFKLRYGQIFQMKTTDVISNLLFDQVNGGMKYVQAKIYEIRVFIDGIVSKTLDFFPVILIQVDNHQWNNHYCE